MFMPMFDKATRQLVTRARTLGTGDLSINLQDHELLRLCAVVATDLEKQHLVDGLVGKNEIPDGYYSMSLEWFTQPTPLNIDFIETFLLLKQNIVDFVTYFEKLCELHK